MKANFEEMRIENNQLKSMLEEWQESGVNTCQPILSEQMNAEIQTDEDPEWVICTSCSNGFNGIDSTSILYV